jgi:hypothetical protein
MPFTPSAVVMKKLELRSKSMAANKEELTHLEGIRLKVDGTLAEMKDLTAQQASLTAAKQEVTKRLATATSEALKLLTFVDAGIREHYGNRAEKLVEFGQQPFRSQPRVRLVGPDGQPVKPGPTPAEPSPTPAEPPAPPLKETSSR